MYISGTAYPIYPNEMPQSGIQVKLDRSGKVTIFSGASDIGQGTNSLPAYLIAEEIGCDPRDCTVVVSDTDLTPVDLGAYSSRGTFMVGIACVEAGQRLWALLAEAVGEKWGVPPEQRRRRAGHASSAPTALTLPFREAVQLAEAKFGTLGATGSYRTQKLGGDYRGGTIGASPAYSFTAHVAEVQRRPSRPASGRWRSCGPPTTAARRSTPPWSRGRSRAASTWASARRRWRR